MTDKIDPFQLFITAQLQALETLLVMLVQRDPTLQRIVQTQYALVQEKLALGGSIPGQPELADLLTGELQEAWQRLMRRVLSPPG